MCSFLLTEVNDSSPRPAERNGFVDVYRNDGSVKASANCLLQNTPTFYTPTFSFGFHLAVGIPLMKLNSLV